MVQAVSLGNSSPAPKFFSGAFGNILKNEKIENTPSDKTDYDLEKQVLSDRDNRKILSALRGLRFANRKLADMNYFYGAAPEKLLDKLSAGTPYDQLVSQELRDNGSYTVDCQLDGNVRAFVVPSQVEDLAYTLNAKIKEVQRFVAAHEMVHKLTYNNFRNSPRSWVKEVVADYVAMQISDPKLSFYLRLTNDDYRYYPLNYAAVGAVDRTLKQVDENLSGHDFVKLLADNLKPEEPQIIMGVIVEPEEKLFEPTFKATLNEYLDENGFAGDMAGDRSRLFDQMLKIYAAEVEKKAFELTAKM